MGNNFRTILLTILIVILLGAGGFIVYTLLNSDQAPEFSSAGGGGGVCCTGSYDDGDANCVGGAFGDAIPCCENLGYFPAHSVGGSAECGPNDPCTGSDYRSSNDASGWLVQECVEITDSGPTTICNTNTDRIAQFQVIGGQCNSGSECPLPPAGFVAVCDKTDGSATGTCKAAPVNECFWYEGSSLRCDCGCPSQEEVCAPGVYGIQDDIRCENCDNPIVYDCGDPPPSTSGGEDDGGNDDGGSTSTPVCGDPDFVPGPGQCNTPGVGNCSQTCQTINVDDPVCGDDDYIPADGECSPPGTSTCDENCQPIPVVTDTEIGLIKTSSSQCEADNSQRINYRVTLTNQGAENANYTIVRDILPAGIETTDVSNISGEGVASTEGGRTVITWPQGILTASQSQNFTYTLEISSTKATTLPSNLENVVTVDYPDGNNNEEIIYTNSTILNCAQPALPSTNFEFNQFTLYFSAIGMILLAGVFYSTGLFKGQVYWIFESISLILNKKERQKYERDQFERNLFKDNE